MYLSKVPQPEDMKMFIVFFHEVKPIHLLIQWISKKAGWKMRDTPNHVALGFGFEGCPSPEFVIEAAGPIKDVSVRSWTRICDEMENWGHREWIECAELDFDAQTAWSLYQYAQELVAADTQYSVKQLLQIYLFIRFGLPIKDSPGSMICSEFVSRVLEPAFSLPEALGMDHDYITPADIMQFVEDDQQEVMHY